MISVAIVQAAPAAFELERTLERVEALAREAREGGAELIVFPEAFVGGYPKGADFGVRVGSRSEEGRVWFQRYFDGALSIPGPGFERLTSLARELDATLVIGVIEREGGTLYCSVLTLDPSGLLHRHRKIVPTAMERVIWGRGDGASIRAVDTRVGRVGAAICWENYMPPLRQRLYESGAAIYCAPTVDDREIWQASMRHIAYEGRCFVLSACQFAKRSDFPDDYECPQSDDPEAVLIGGGSCIVDPFGAVIAGPLLGEAGIVRAELDMGAITRGKFDLDLAGHYGRPDIFS